MSTGSEWCPFVGFCVSGAELTLGFIASALSFGFSLL